MTEAHTARRRGTARPATDGLLTLPPRGAQEPKSHWLYRSLRDAILNGQLHAGDRLPTTRQLATQQHVSRGVVVEVYEQLCAEGYAEGRVSVGTFVTEALSDSFAAERGRRRTRPVAATPRLSPTGLQLIAEFGGLATPSEPPIAELPAFTLRAPGFDLFPRAIWAQLTRRRLLRADMLLAQAQYPRGGRLQVLLAEYLRTMRGVICEPSQIFFPSVIGGGLQVALHMLLEHGEALWVEDPGQPMAVSLAAQAGVDCIRVPVDHGGFDVRVAEALRPDARFVLVTPAHQDVYGTPMTIERRLALLEWADRSNGWIFEADYDSEHRFHGRPTSSLHHLGDGSRVFYSGTFMQLLFPAARISYLVVPPQLVEPFQRVRSNILNDSNPLLLAVLEDFIADGHFERHLRRCREAFRARLQAFRIAVERHASDVLRLDRVDSGSKIVAWLQPPLTAAEAVRRAARIGFVVTPIDVLTLARTDLPPGLMLGFAVIPEEQIDEAVRRLAEALRHGDD